MILNELSMKSNVKKQEDAERILSDFLKLCNKIFREKGDRDFYCTQEWLSGELCPGYTIWDWFQNPRVSQQDKAFLRTMMNKRSLIEENDFLGSELIVEMQDNQEASAKGCLAAYEWESYVVSMDTNPLWRAPEVHGTYLSLEEENREVSVANCCMEEHLSLLEKREKDTIRSMVSSGKELWEKRERIYPHLKFCDSVEKQLEEARISLHIQIIMKRLQILEDYFKDFDGRFDKEKLGHDCREESESVKKNDALRKLRIFQTPYGKEEFFSWHISFPGSFPGRIHFIPDGNHKMGIVGYIGKHLPTAKHSTI